MRRKDREITEMSALEAIISESVVCRLAFVDRGRPYIVPMNFGYRDNTLYFHSAPAGRKIGIMETNPGVCFELDTGTELVEGDEACAWSLKYRSVIGFGTASFIEDPEEKRMAVNIIMQHYSDPGKTWHIPGAALMKTAVFKVEIESMTGKQSL